MKPIMNVSDVATVEELSESDHGYRAGISTSKFVSLSFSNVSRGIVIGFICM